MPRRRKGDRLADAEATSGSQGLERVLDSLADAVLLTDADDRVTFVNPAAEQIAGLPRMHALGRSCAEVFELTPAIAKMVRDTRTTGQEQSRGEETLRCGGREAPVRVSCSPIWGSGDRVEGVALVVHDLSYQRTLEREARRNETLAHLGGLVAGLAHEVKNPLGGIKGAAQLLTRRFGDTREIAEYTGIMIREVDRLVRLVDELLTFGAPAPLEASALNIHRVLEEAIALMLPDLRAKRILLRLEYDPSLPEVRGDEGRLTHVFLNLVKNAMEATPAAGQLVIRTRMETDFHILRAARDSAKFLRVEIADSGPGFPPEVVDRVFEPFFTTKVRGTGLGLAICERTVAEHGGSIRAGNRPQGGAVVTVVLPVSPT